MSQITFTQSLIEEIHSTISNHLNKPLNILSNTNFKIYMDYDLAGKRFVVGVNNDASTIRMFEYNELDAAIKYYDSIAY